jgi:hypothetical protein
MSNELQSTESPRVTQPQCDTMVKVFARLFRGSGSTVIGLGSDYTLLNAVGKGDKDAAHTAIDAFIDKDQQKRADYKASLASKEVATK